MRSIAATMLALTLGMSVAEQASAAMLTVRPSQSSATVGDTLSVVIAIEDLVAAGAPSLGGYDLHLSFDASVLELQAVTFGSGLGLSMQDSILDEAGAVHAFEVSLERPETLDLQQPGAFALFTVTFTALSIGTSDLGLSIHSLADADGNALLAGVQASSVSVVPLPAAAGLLLSGLAGLGWLSRGQRRVAGEAA